MLIYYIEDDEQMFELWSDTISEVIPEAEFKWFESAYQAWQACGNPVAIVFDVGSVGLMHDIDMYLSVYHQIRDRFPGAYIFLCSGMYGLPSEMKKEIGEDSPLVIPINNLTNLPWIIQENLAA